MRRSQRYFAVYLNQFRVSRTANKRFKIFLKFKKFLVTGIQHKYERSTI